MDTAKLIGEGRISDLVNLLASVASEDEGLREILALAVAGLLMKGGFASSDASASPQSQSNLPS